MSLTSARFLSVSLTVLVEVEIELCSMRHGTEMW